jgi:hypothetical protein
MKDEKLEVIIKKGKRKYIDKARDKVDQILGLTQMSDELKNLRDSENSELNYTIMLGDN